MKPALELQLTELIRIRIIASNLISLGWKRPLRKQIYERENKSAVQQELGEQKVRTIPADA